MKKILSRIGTTTASSQVTGENFVTTNEERKLGEFNTQRTH